MLLNQLLLDKARSGPWLPYRGETGCGIVICAGGIYMPSCYVAIRHIRRSGCNLPIEVWALDSTEIPFAWSDLFQDLDATVRYAIPYSEGYQVCRGYECKLIAVMNSSFRHVLLLDADNITLKDPTYLFESIPYRKHGQIFWPDQPFQPSDRWAIQPQAFDELGLPRQIGLELETGQLMIDRQVCWQQLQLTELFNQRSREVYQRYTWGDKDTFVLAWLLLSQEYFVVPHRPKCTPPILWQYDLAGNPCFQHQRKWLASPYAMRERLLEDELFATESLTYLNDYYKLVQWIGELRFRHFNPR